MVFGLSYIPRSQRPPKKVCAWAKTKAKTKAKAKIKDKDKRQKGL